MISAHMFDPYCGPAPNPETLLSSWNFDWILIALTGVALFTLFKFKAASDSRYGAALGIVLFIVFISPLCALSTALFSARTVHHILVGSVAAPLIALMLPPVTKRLAKVPVELIFLIHTAIYWLWHLPFSYNFALSGTAQYWLMQTAFIAASVWLWSVLLSPRTSVFSVLGLSVGTMVQMGFLGAILTFAPRALFEPHLTTTQLFALTPLQDQQLSGVLMWTLGFAPYVVVAFWALRSRLLPDARLQEPSR